MSCLPSPLPARAHSTHSPRTPFCRFVAQRTYFELSGGLGNDSVSALASVSEALAQSQGHGVHSNAKPDMLFRQLSVPRQYFHSKTGQPILPDEVDCDSDDDVDESWILTQGDRVRVRVLWRWRWRDVLLCCCVG